MIEMSDNDSDDDDVIVATAAAVDDDEDIDDAHSTSDAEQHYERDIEEDDMDDDEEAVAAEAVVEDDDDDNSDGGEAVPVVAAAAALVDDDGDDEEEGEGEAVAVAVVTGDDTGDGEEEDDDPPILPKPKGKRKSKTSPKKGSKGNKGKGKKKDKGKGKKKKGKGRRQANGTGIAGDRLTAAEAAREILLQTVPRLPVPMNESYTVRNFGQLRIEQDGGINAFSTPNALYPVGFCCDRYEFSPVHGRVVKMRCSILDGQRTNLNYNGPIFRIMWGQGVDEDVDKVEYPYNPYANSSPINDGEDDVVAVPASQASGGKGSMRQGAPSKGMRVKVRFDKDQFYYGTIEKVVTGDKAEKGEKKKKRKKNVKILIRYDDGSSEDAIFPDPDISLVMPGMY